jgi:hypothetical protein
MKSTAGFMAPLALLFAATCPNTKPFRFPLQSNVSILQRGVRLSLSKLLDFAATIFRRAQDDKKELKQPIF